LLRLRGSCRAPPTRNREAYSTLTLAVVAVASSKRVLCAPVNCVRVSSFLYVCVCIVYSICIDRYLERFVAAPVPAHAHARTRAHTGPRRQRHARAPACHRHHTFHGLSAQASTFGLTQGGSGEWQKQGLELHTNTISGGHGHGYVPRLHNAFKAYIVDSLVDE